MTPLRYIDSHVDEMVRDLRKLIAQPSVSATGEGIAECASLVAGMLKKSGIHSEILRIRGAPPLVYGHVMSRSNPSRTLLFYNHYDVQPAEPLDRWRYPPFSGTRKGNRVYGRGATDDKGELITRIKAVESHLRTTGDVPCNIKFVIEGEEETGSASIARYLKKYRRKFSCDGVIWEFGYVDAKGRPIVGLGMKGLLYVELSARGPVRDAHSSLAVLIENPAWRLVRALQTLRSPDGRILIRDWYREAVPFSKRDIKLLAEEPFDEKSFREEFGIGSFVGKRRGLDAKKALAGHPTCNIAGLASGYAGDGAKTVLPGRALAKIDFRLVPGMDPKRQVMRLRRHLRSNGFGDIGLRVYHGEAAARTNPSDPFVGVVRDAADSVFGGSVLSVSNAGTGPMHQFSDILGAPCVSVGCTYMFSRIHSPNEFARVDLLRKAAKCMHHVMENLGGS